MCSVVLSLCYQVVERCDAGVLGVIPQIGFDGPETEYVDPAIDARDIRYDVDGVHAKPHSGGGAASPMSAHDLSMRT